MTQFRSEDLTQQYVALVGIRKILAIRKLTKINKIKN